MNKKLLLVLLALFLFPIVAVLILTLNTGQAQKTSMVKVYMVALEDNGKYGKRIACNDSIVAVERKVPLSNDPLKASLDELFSIKGGFYGKTGLYNFLSNSSLKLDDVVIDYEGKILVHISGALGIKGVCDVARIEAQIKETVRQYAEDKDVLIFINGKETSVMASLMERRR